MQTHPVYRIVGAVAAVLLSMAPGLPAAPWSAWRGDVAGSGSTSESEIPLEWSREKNVRWRIDLPGPGNSTPVIHGGRVFVTQAVPDENFRGLFCFERKTGKLLWKKGVTYKKKERTHRQNYYCSASPATDGKIVVAAYGSAGIAAYDFDGNEIWKRELGPADHVWGNSSSPVLYGGLCLHYHGPGPGGYLIALDRKSGEPVWKWDEPDWKPGKRTDGFRGRDDEGVIGSFSTPILIDTGERHELVMSFPMEIKAFDPGSGKELWSCGGLSPLIYTSPIFGDGIVVAMGGYQGDSIGVKAGGNGDVTRSQRLWQEVRHNGGIGTGVVKDGYTYYQNSGGVAYCIEMATGKNRWEARLPGAGKSWGSFLLAGDNIFSLSQAGDCVVFKADPNAFQVISQSNLGEETNSSPAVSDGEIFIRTHQALWCIGAD